MTCPDCPYAVQLREFADLLSSEHAGLYQWETAAASYRKFAAEHDAALAKNPEVSGAESNDGIGRGTESAPTPGLPAKEGQ